MSKLAEFYAENLSNSLDLISDHVFYMVNNSYRICFKIIYVYICIYIIPVYIIKFDLTKKQTNKPNQTKQNKTTKKNPPKCITFRKITCAQTVILV